eukprot:196046-Rhodomonas_salina.2
MMRFLSRSFARCISFKLFKTEQQTFVELSLCVADRWHRYIQASISTGFGQRTHTSVLLSRVALQKREKESLAREREGGEKQRAAAAKRGAVSQEGDGSMHEETRFDPSVSEDTLKADPLLSEETRQFAVPSSSTNSHAGSEAQDTAAGSSLSTGTASRLFASSEESCCVEGGEEACGKGEGSRVSRSTLQGDVS